MSGSLLSAAFGHNTWATLQVIDACSGLSADRLQTNVPGTRGPIIETLRHIVAADAVDLEIATGERADDFEHSSPSEVRDAAERIGAAWTRFLSQQIDPDTHEAVAAQVVQLELGRPARALAFGDHTAVAAPSILQSHGRAPGGSVGRSPCGV